MAMIKTKLTKRKMKCLKPMSFRGLRPSTPLGGLRRAPECLSDRYKMPQIPEFQRPQPPGPHAN